MAEIITHSFISAKTQSPDTTLVSKNEWNDGHVFTGGTNGQVLIYDNTQPNNIRWTDGGTVYSSAQSIVSSTPTPLTNLAPLTIISNSGVIAVCTLAIGGYASVGNANGNFVLLVNGNAVISFALTSPQGALISVTSNTTLTAGTKAVSVTATTTGAVNILALICTVNIFTLGT